MSASDADTPRGRARAGRGATAVQRRRWALLAAAAAAFALGLAVGADPGEKPGQAPPEPNVAVPPVTVTASVPSTPVSVRPVISASRLPS